MAGEPKRRHSKSRKRTRRASISQAAPVLVSCKNCSKPTLSHTVCRECGYYGQRPGELGTKKVKEEKVKVTTA